ncbi:MAG: hypothetical protein PF961_12065, partial [Planctomycetota bacterium]|nr:hypothetical protein [Planctomycetota bacterium]
MVSPSALSRWCLLVCCGLTSACSTGWRLDEQRVAAMQALEQGDPATASAIVNEIYASHLAGEPGEPGGSAESDTDISSKHGLLWQMERGLIALRSDDLDGAIYHFDDARERAEALMASDLVAGATSMIANDTVRDYVGTAYERESSAYFLALCHLIQGQRQNGTLAGAYPSGSDTALARLDRALNQLRNLCLVQVPRTESYAGGERYRGAAYFHLAAAATVLTQDEPLASDYDFAASMLQRAVKRYPSEYERYHGESAWRYEVTTLPLLMEALRWRLLHARGGGDLEDAVAATGSTEADLRQSGRLPHHNFGSLLVLEHRDYAIRPQPLDIRLISTDLGSHSSSRRDDDFRVGWMGFSVTGPGAWQASEWGALPFPGKLTGELAPGVTPKDVILAVIAQTGTGGGQ